MRSLREGPAAILELDEASVVAEAGRGDRVAFERLVAARIDRLYRTARAILGNEPEARDATQEALISAWVNLPRLRDPERFDAWLHRVVVNACRDVGRRRRRSLEIALDGQELPVADAHAEVASRVSFNAAFDRLSVDDRWILVMHHLHQVPVVDLARHLSVPVGTAKWRLHHARRALERAMEAEQ